MNGLCHSSVVARELGPEPLEVGCGLGVHALEVGLGTLACAANAAGGGNTRFSCETDSIDGMLKCLLGQLLCGAGPGKFGNAASAWFRSSLQRH